MALSWNGSWCHSLASSNLALSAWRGRIARPSAPVSKAGEGNSSVGSNPTFAAFEVAQQRRGSPIRRSPAGE
jgi:hypothetical protein